MPDAIAFHNYILDAVLFLLFTGRYFWGPPTEMLRFTLFLMSGWVVVADMNLYYYWAVPWFDLTFAQRQVVGKGIIGIALVLDFLKDWLDVRRRWHIKELVSFGKAQAKSERKGGMSR